MLELLSATVNLDAEITATAFLTVIFKSLSIANGTTLTKADVKKIKKEILIIKKEKK